MEVLVLFEHTKYGVWVVVGGGWVVKNIGKEGEVITIENYGEFMYQMMERG